MESLDNLTVTLHTNKPSLEKALLGREGAVHTAVANPSIQKSQPATGNVSGNKVAERMAHKYLGTHRKLFAILLTQ